MKFPVSYPLPTRASRKTVPAHPTLFPGQLLALAEQYLLQSKMRPEGHPFGLVFWAAYHSTGHAAELALKAYLARNGKTETDVRAYGHDLQRLLDDAMASWLGLDSRDYETLSLLDPIHAEFWARYVKNHSAPVLVITEFDGAMAALFERVRNEFGTGAVWAKF